MEKVDIGFFGYDDDPRALHEILEVRNFVYKLDESFPYWLYFLSKHSHGLRCILLCHLPPFLTPDAKARIFPERIRELLSTRWVPAMNEACLFAGISEAGIEQLTNRVVEYLNQ